MDKLKQIEAFVAANQWGSLARAAQVIGVTPALLGRRITALESRLGVRLLHRSTRHLGLTEEGAVFLQRCQGILSQIELAEEEITAVTEGASGHLSVTAPGGFGRRHVAPHGPGFMADNPRVRMSFYLDDRVLDLKRRGYDLGIRIGDIKDLDLVAVKLAANRRVVCAAPSYLQKYGVPETLEDLENHNCLAFNPLGGQQGGWDFICDGKPVIIRAGGDLDCNDGVMLHRWAVEGLGLAWRSTWEIQSELASGELVTVLDEYTQSDFDIYAVYPQQVHVPTKIKLFVEYLKAIYQSEGYWTAPKPD